MADVTTERRLWTTLLLGSNLYGTAVEGSDRDLLEIYFPTTDELVNNRRLTLPQCIKDGIDTRQILLGDFVMSLGVNPEHMGLAYQYSHRFGEIQTAWLNGRALHNILNAAENMWDNGKTPKNRAHAYRYTVMAWMMARGQEALYPLQDTYLITYMELRNDDPNGQLSNEGFKDYHTLIRRYVKTNWSSDQYPNRKRMAEWVMLRYLNLA